MLSNIEEGIYKDKIPTEKQLQELFQVSRITVRQAIDELVSDGYLVRERAKGTRIVKKKIAENLNSLCNFTNEMKKKNIPYVLHSVNMSVVKADKEIADALEIEKERMFMNFIVYIILRMSHFAVFLRICRRLWI